MPSQLDLDHWENNVLARIEAAERRLEDLERCALIRASDKKSIEIDTGISIDASRDYYINNQSTALGRTIGTFLALPALRGFWPMSCVDYTSSGQAKDLSGNGYHLTANNIPLFSHDTLAPFVALNGTNEDLTRTDGGAANWADITGTEGYIAAAKNGLTLGGWFRADGTGAGSLISKWGAAGNDSYELRIAAGPTWVFIISDDGTNTDSGTSSDYAATRWHFVVGRFEPSTYVSVFVNGVWSHTTTARASVFDSSADFHIGSRSTSANYYDGRASMCFLSAAYISDDILSALFNQTRGLFEV